MDSTQIVIITVITVLTILLTVIGIQVVYILLEFRKMFQKVNKMMDGAVTLSENFTKSVSEIAGVTAGIKSVFGLVNIFKKKGDKEN